MRNILILKKIGEIFLYFSHEFLMIYVSVDVNECIFLQENDTHQMAVPYFK